MAKIGSARIDEHGNVAGGIPGDQKQKGTPDYNGEVSQQDFYVHTLGWYVLRAKSQALGDNLAKEMRIACDNPNIGYSQTKRADIIRDTVNSPRPTSCDCSTLVRACMIAACGIDPGNFTTYNEKTILLKTGLFECFGYTRGDLLKDGDILVTQRKGHTVIVTEGDAKPQITPTTGAFYPAYTGKSNSIVDGLISCGERNTTFVHRKRIAEVNGVKGYTGTSAQNLLLLSLLKRGKLKKG